MSMILTLRVTTEQRQRWREAADREGLSLSRWMRKRCDAGQKEEVAKPKKSARERILELVCGGS